MDSPNVGYQGIIRMLEEPTRYCRRSLMVSPGVARRAGAPSSPGPKEMVIPPFWYQANFLVLGHARSILDPADLVAAP